MGAKRVGQESSSHTVLVPPPSASVRDQIADAVALIGTKQRFIVTGHASPDGDVVGSCLALFHVLRSLGKDVIVVNVDPVPFNLRFLSGVEGWRQDVPEAFDAEVTCLLDCAERARAGASFPAHGWGEQLMIIDHHKLAPTDGDIVVHDAKAGATAELIYRLAAALGAPLTQALSECLYTALVMDTGGFRYGSATPTVFAMASNLVAKGVDVWHVTSHVFESNPVARVRLLSAVLRTLEVSPCGRLAMLRVTREMITEVGANEDMLDGFINHARSIEGVEVAAQLREIGPDHYRISFRSRGRVDVSNLARRFGGGGHRNAAGCSIEGRWEQVQRQLEDVLYDVLDGPKKGMSG